MTDINSEVRMGFKESFSLIFVCLTSKMFCSYLPDTIARYGPSAWIVMLISGLLSAALFYVYVKSDMNADQILKSALGNVPGSIVTYALGVYFVIYTAFNLGEIIKIIKIYNFPETPEALFAIVFITASVFINYNGLYSVGKLSEFYVKLIIITFIALFLLGAGQYRFELLTPVFGFGIKNIVSGCFFELSLFTDVLILMFLVKESGGGKTSAKVGSSAILFATLVFVLSAICYTAVFDYTVSGGKESGLIELAKNMYYGQIFQRTESLFFLIMVLSSAISVCTRMFGSVHILSSAFDIKDKRQTLLITAVSVYALCKNEWDIGIFGIIAFLIPVISALIGKVRRI